MDDLFTNKYTDEKLADKINLDELYERKHKSDLNKLHIYNKILNRIHNHIKTVSRQKNHETFCWYVIPEVIIGAPKYDQTSCVTYIIDKLQSNKFLVKYTHPNLLFISWKHWVPLYVRNEIKKKTGMNIDGLGNVVSEKEKTKEINSITLNTKLDINKKDKREFRPITTYRPTGNLIYNQDLIKKIEDKL